MFGPDTKQAYGHLGFMNILCWADPQRDISVAILNTGKSLGGRHVLAFADVLRTISEECA
jgi:CubicO group peptidase (beta-lactamase class C family)